MLVCRCRSRRWRKNAVLDIDTERFNGFIVFTDLFRGVLNELLVQCFGNAIHAFVA